MMWIVFVPIEFGNLISRHYGALLCRGTGFGGISRAGVSTRITDKSSRNVRNKSKSPMLTEDTMDLLDESAMKRAMASAGRANGASVL